MTRDDLLARLRLDTADLAAWTDLIRLDTRAKRPTLTKEQAKAAGKSNRLVKIGTRPAQWPHLVDAARDGVCSWHVGPNPGDNRLRGIVLIRPAAESAGDARTEGGLIIPPPAPPRTPEEEAADAELKAEIESTPVPHISARNPKSRRPRVADLGPEPADAEE